MKTFLEYACARLMGPPSRSDGDGESYWPCPACGHDRFHSLPSKPKYRDRVKCWSCGFRGDVFDLLKLFHPTEDYPRQRVRIDAWQDEFLDGINAPTPDPRSAPAHPISSLRGAGTLAPQDDPRDVASAFAEMTHDQQAALLEVHAIARSNGVSLEALARDCQAMVDHIAESDIADYLLEIGPTAVLLYHNAS